MMLSIAQLDIVEDAVCFILLCIMIDVLIQERTTRCDPLNTGSSTSDELFHIERHQVATTR
jgi:hypothetical protein